MNKIIYNPHAIEEKWKDRWKKEGTYKTKEENLDNKAYVLGMFPYPSGEGLHTGHVRI